MNGDDLKKRKSREALFEDGGKFWQAASSLSRILRPSVRFEKCLREERSKLWSRHPNKESILTIHIRRGDSCRDGRRTGRKCSHGSFYAEAALRIMESAPFDAVFLATDSDEAITELRTAFAESGLVNLIPIVTRNIVRKNYAESFGRIEQAFEKQALDPWVCFYDFLVDQILLSEGVGFVGKFTSNMDRIAYALQSARARHFTSYTSLDAAWCWGGDGYSPDSYRKRGANDTMGMFPC
jgi:hypothetical protein